MYMKHVVNPHTPAYVNTECEQLPLHTRRGGFAWAVQTVEQAGQQQSSPEGSIPSLVDATVGEALAMAFNKCRAVSGGASGPGGTPQSLCLQAGALLRQIDAQLQAACVHTTNTESWVYSARSPADGSLPASGCAPGSGLPPAVPAASHTPRSAEQRIIHNAHMDVADARLVAAELMQSLSSCQAELLQARQELHAAAKQQTASRALQLKLQAENVKLHVTGQQLSKRLGEVMQQAAGVHTTQSTTPEAHLNIAQSTPPRVEIPQQDEVSSPASSDSPLLSTVLASPLTSDFVLGTGGGAARGQAAPASARTSLPQEPNQLHVAPQASPGRAAGGIEGPPVGFASSGEESPAPQHAFSALLGHLTADTSLKPDILDATVGAGSSLPSVLAASGVWAEDAASDSSGEGGHDTTVLDLGGSISPHSQDGQSSTNSPSGDMFHSVQDTDALSI